MQLERLLEELALFPVFLAKKVVVALQRLPLTITNNMEPRLQRHPVP
jgi:hypothetical protein